MISHLGNYDLDASSSNESRDKTNDQKVKNDTSSNEHRYCYQLNRPGSSGGRGCPASGASRLKIVCLELDRVAR